MVCFDTDLLIALIRERDDAVNFLKSLGKAVRLTTTFVSACELYEGAYRSNNPEKELERVEKVLGVLTILMPSAELADSFGKVSGNLENNGQPIGNFDVLIACIAMKNGETLVSRNIKHFDRIQGLKLISW